MLESLFKSMLPEGFDIQQSINQFQQIASDFTVIRATVSRIESKVDSELVTLRDRVAALESPARQVSTLAIMSGESNVNDHRSATGTGSADVHGTTGG